MDADKLETAEERFLIMDSQTDANQDFIFETLTKEYGPEISSFLKNKYGLTATKAPRIQKNGGILTRPTNYTTDGKEALKTANLNAVANVSTLAKYIEAGINLIPTKPNDSGSFYQLKKGKGTAQEEIIKIDSLPGLNYWISHDINRFIFIPKEAGFLCLDIDRNHGDGVDGLESFYNWLKANGLEKIPLFKDLDGGSFPVYTTTASGGLHLYFKCNADLKTFATIVPGVEIKYNGLNLTAGGSIKNGKLYSLHGNLQNAPQLPAPLLLRFSKELSKEPAKPKTWQAKKPEWKNKKGYTSDQLINFARNDASGGNHEIIFQMALRLKRAGYQEAETLAIIEQTPEHQGRNDKADTITCIKSIYR